MKAILTVLLIVLVTNTALCQDRNDVYEDVRIGPKTVPKPIIKTPEYKSMEVFKSPKISSAEINGLLFYEDFDNNNASLAEQKWYKEDSGHGTIAFGVDPVTKLHYVEIEQTQPNGQTFINIDLSKILAGKTAFITAKIKTVNIVTQNSPFQGELCLKYVSNGIPVFECVQNLVGDIDWRQKYTTNHGGNTIDDVPGTKNSYIFRIPEDAEDIILYLGMQESTGKILVSDLKIFDATVIQPNKISGTRIQSN